MIQIYACKCSIKSYKKATAQSRNAWQEQVHTGQTNTTACNRDTSMPKKYRN